MFERLSDFYSEAKVAEIAREPEEAASGSSVRKRGEFELPPVNEMGVTLTWAQENAMAKEDCGSGGGHGGCGGWSSFA